LASNIVPIEMTDCLLFKVARVVDGPVYVGALGRWFHIPDNSSHTVVRHHR
jgi:hypothetical protein